MHFYSSNIKRQCWFADFSILLSQNFALYRIGKNHLLNIQLLSVNQIFKNFKSIDSKLKIDITFPRPELLFEFLCALCSLQPPLPYLICTMAYYGPFRYF